jgi:nucleotide-binding universal stress UspA family protein
MAKPVALVSLDGSDTAAYVLPWARVFSSGLDLQLVLLELAPAARGGGERGTGALQAADEYLRGVASTLRRDGYEVETRPLPAGGAVAEWINAAAEELHASLAMLATRGRMGVRRMMLGSIADQLLRTGMAPVVLVRGAEQPAAH